METLGGPGVSLAVAAENVFPPLPSEVILPLAGFTASQGDAGFGLVGALLWTTAGSLLGALIMYGLGAALGPVRLRRVWGRLPLINLDDLDRTEAWFARHGRKAVFFGRMIPVFRSLVSIPAGVERMPIGVFVLLTVAGSAIWNGVFVTAGYLLGEQWHRVEPYADTFQAVVIVLAVIAACLWLVALVRRHRRTRASSTRGRA